MSAGERKRTLKQKMQETFHIQHWHAIAAYMIAWDVFISAGSYFLALWLRFDGRVSMIPPVYYHAWARFVPIFAVVTVVVFGLMRLYKVVWRFAGYSVLYRATIAVAMMTVVHIDRKSTRLNSSHGRRSRMPSSA